MEGVEEDRAIERLVRERQRLRAGLVKPPLRDHFTREGQRLYVGIHPGNVRPPVRQRTREDAGAAADIE
jgi:hypothetical protein